MKERIIPFRIVKVNIPQKKLRKLFYDDDILCPKDLVKISRKLTEIEKNITYLQHAASIVEKILLRRA